MTQAMTVFGTTDDNAVAQLKNCLADERAVAGALMADGHLGYSMPIGGVIAYDGAVSPSGVGYDIACGNKAVKTGLYIHEISDSVPMFMKLIQQTISFGLGRQNRNPIEHELFESPLWREIHRFAPGLKAKAELQLGTVGSGNHYVDLLFDEDDRVWVACHFGSRGFGHTIATGFLNLAAGKQFDDRGRDAEEPTVIPTDTELGAFYIDCMKLAGEYAYAGRDYVVDQVLGILGTTAHESVHCHHNSAWLEDGLWVVRKGATPLTDKAAFIGGSMGDISVIVRGVTPGCDCGIPLLEGAGQHSPGCSVFKVNDVGALGSAPHGAGRVMSRTKAAGKMRKFTETRKRQDGSEYQFKVRRRDPSTAAIDWPTVHAQLAGQGITVLGSGADEAPGVYKDLRTVLSAHSNIEVLHELHPVGVVMAGEDIADPYRD